MSIKYVKGDLFTNLKGKKHIVVPHLVNNINAWGAGFTGQISKYYPSVERDFRRRSHYYSLGDSFFSEHEDVVFYHMMAQEGIGTGKRRVRYDHLVECMKNIFMAFGNNLQKIYAPRFGSGLAGGNVQFIEDLVEDIWGKSMSLDVTVFTL